jgi:hypothetical protein
MQASRVFAAVSGRSRRKAMKAGSSADLGALWKKFVDMAIRVRHGRQTRGGPLISIDRRVKRRSISFQTG